MNTLKSEKEHVIAGGDLDVPAEYRIAFRRYLYLPMRNLGEALLQEGVTMVGRVERYVGGYIFPGMFLTKNVLFVQWRQD